MSTKSYGTVSKGVAYDSSAEIDMTMEPDVQYTLTVSSVAWLLIAPTGGTAVAQADNNHMIPAGLPVPVAAIGGANRCVLVKDTDAGWAQLSKMYPPD